MSDRLRELLRDTDPVDVDEIRSRPTPRELFGAIIANEANTEVMRQRRRPVRVALTLAVATALVVAVVVSLPGSPGGASPGAAQVLDVQASIASAEASPTPGDGFAYYKLYEASRGTFVADQPFSFRSPVTVEAWVAADGSGRVREVPEGVEWPGPRDKERWQAQGSPPLGISEQVSDETFGPGELNGVGPEGALPPTRDLPADPDQLVEIFRARAASSSPSVPTNVKMFEYASSVLLETGSTPELRAALYQVVAGIDGVELAGDARDPLGRTGTGVSLVSDYGGAPQENTLIFDPDTSQPLAYTERLLEPQDWIDGRMLVYAIVKDSAYVQDTNTRP
jgi:hypothetical protein